MATGRIHHLDSTGVGGRGGMIDRGAQPNIRFIESGLASGVNYTDLQPGTPVTFSESHVPTPGIPTGLWDLAVNVAPA